MTWIAWSGGLRRGEFKARIVAQNSFFRPYYVRGKAEVRNAHTGETWERRGAGWYKTAEPYEKDAAGAGAGDLPEPGADHG